MRVKERQGSHAVKQDILSQAPDVPPVTAMLRAVRI
jgi:hypothetical protein